MSRKDKAKQTSNKILNAAMRMFGRMGYRGASMNDVAEEAGVSKSLLHYHFHTKERLLIEAQRSTIRGLHQRFSQRASQGHTGLSAALEALDAMWNTVRDLREGAPFIVETLSLSGQKTALRKHLRSFYRESTGLLSNGITQVFDGQVEELTIPPERMATLIRILLEGLIVELAQVKTAEELAEIEQAYADLRELFSRFALKKKELKHTEDEGFPLPW